MQLICGARSPSSFVFKHPKQPIYEIYEYRSALEYQSVLPLSVVDPPLPKMPSWSDYTIYQMGHKDRTLRVKGGAV